MSRSNDLAVKVLETWPGTAEELGVLLYDAIMIVANQQDAERKYDARRRIAACPGGQELIDEEERAFLYPQSR